MDTPEATEETTDTPERATDTEKLTEELSLVARVDSLAPNLRLTLASLSTFI